MVLLCILYDNANMTMSVPGRFSEIRALIKSGRKNIHDNADITVSVTPGRLYKIREEMKKWKHKDASGTCNILKSLIEKLQFVSQVSYPYGPSTKFFFIRLTKL